MKKIVLLLLPFLLYSETLKELILIAQNNNDLVVSKQYTQKSKSKKLASKTSSYFPTIDIGGFYKYDNKVFSFQAGDTMSGFAKIGYDIYDGGKRTSLIESANYSLNSALYDTQAYKKSLALQITQDFFTIKNLEASLDAREEAKKSLQEQLKRTQSFYDAKMATKDDIDRVQADFDTNIYNMESIKFQILSLKSLLELKVGKNILNLETASFHKSISDNYETLESIKALMAQNSSILSTANAIDSFYYPNVRVEDTYSIYKFNREDPLVTPLKNQNTILLTLDIRLFDYGKIAKEKESVLLSTQALKARITHQTKEQKVQYKLSKMRILTAKARIKSAKSAFKAASSAFTTIEKKYNARIVDYIVYLETLTKKMNSKALYKTSLNDLEVAYATLYFYQAKDLKKELK